MDTPVQVLDPVINNITTMENFLPILMGLKEHVHNE